MIFKIFLIILVLGALLSWCYIQAQEEPAQEKGVLGGIRSFFSNIFGKSWEAVKKVFGAIKNKLFSKESAQQWLNERKQAIERGLEEEKAEIGEAAKIGIKRGVAQVWGSMKDFFKENIID